MSILHHGPIIVDQFLPDPVVYRDADRACSSMMPCAAAD